MGLETVHPAALEALNKRMTTDDFARAADDLRRRDVSLSRVFVLIAPPFVPAEEQDEWLLRSSRGRSRAVRTVARPSR